MPQDDMKEIVDYLSELLSDHSVPRNIKMKIEEVVTFLNNTTDRSLKVNKALSILEEISDDNNIQTYTRTQIWNAVSMLEALN